MRASLSLSTDAPMRGAPGPDLVALAQRGDTDAMGALYDAHYGAIYRYLRARVADALQAEDLAADVFRRMLTGLPHYRAVGVPFRAWLFRIAHNVLVDHYRQASSQPSVELDTLEDQASRGSDPEAVVEHTLTMAQAYRALAELEPPQRDVLALRFLSGLSVREIALALHRTEDSVKALQRRGLAALRLALTQD